jgi:hypothetical protein
MPRLPLLALAAAAPLAAALPAPGALDAALFGPLGALALVALVAPLGPAMAGLLPLGGGAAAPTPAAAPAHVLALLGGGALDAGTGSPMPPWAGGGAVFLGGLWSRRLGPHRSMWAWDVVEIAAVDLFAADAAADHAWARGAPLRGAAWGGAGVRLFRIGLAASHHHLSATGVTTPLGDLGPAAAYPAPCAAALAPLARGGAAQPPLRAAPLAQGAPSPRGP